MTPETLEFWKIFFQSPIVAAIAGGLLGALSTWHIAQKQFLHSMEENQKNWERQEVKRKEEREFEKKSQVYEEFFESFDSLFASDAETFIKKFAPISFKIALYSPKHIKDCIAEVYNINLQILNPGLQDDKHKEAIQTRSNLFDTLRYMIINDMQSYIVSDIKQNKN